MLAVPYLQYATGAHQSARDDRSPLVNLSSICVGEEAAAQHTMCFQLGNHQW